MTGGCRGNQPRPWREGALVSDIEARIERLLDQLEQPGISASEIERINEKVTLLQGMQTQSQ